MRQQEISGRIISLEGVHTLDLNNPLKPVIEIEKDSEEIRRVITNILARGGITASPEFVVRPGVEATLRLIEDMDGVVSAEVRGQTMVIEFDPVDFERQSAEQNILHILQACSMSFTPRFVEVKIQDSDPSFITNEPPVDQVVTDANHSAAPSTIAQNLNGEL